MSEEILEFQSYQKYKVEIIYSSTGNMKRIKSYEVQSMDQVKHIVEMYKNERKDYGYSLEEIKVSIVLGWQETFWKTRKPETVADLEKDIANLPAIPQHFKPSEKRWPTEKEIRNRILNDARGMIDMEYVKKINKALDD